MERLHRKNVREIGLIEEGEIIIRNGNGSWGMNNVKMV